MIANKKKEDLSLRTNMILDRFLLSSTTTEYTVKSRRVNTIKLSDNYRKEQAELEEKIMALKAKLSKTTSVKENAEKFVGIISKYDDVTELTAPMLNELIYKIIVHEATKDENGNKSYEIEICFRFIGNID